LKVHWFCRTCKGIHVLSLFFIAKKKKRLFSFFFSTSLLWHLLSFFWAKCASPHVQKEKEASFVLWWLSGLVFVCFGRLWTRLLRWQNSFWKTNRDYKSKFKSITIKIGKNMGWIKKRFGFTKEMYFNDIFHEKKGHYK